MTGEPEEGSEWCKGSLFPVPCENECVTFKLLLNIQRSYVQLCTKRARERGSCNIETLSLGIEAGWDKCAAISGQFPISSAVYTALQTVLTPTLRNSGNEYVNRCNM